MQLETDLETKAAHTETARDCQLSAAHAELWLGELIQVITMQDRGTVIDCWYGF